MISFLLQLVLSASLSFGVVKIDSAFTDGRDHFLVVMSNGGLLWGTTRKLYQLKIVSRLPLIPREVLDIEYELLNKNMTAHLFLDTNMIMSAQGPKLEDGSYQGLVFFPLNEREMQAFLAKIYEGHTRVIPWERQRVRNESQSPFDLFKDCRAWLNPPGTVISRSLH